MTLPPLIKLKYCQIAASVTSCVSQLATKVQHKISLSRLCQNEGAYLSDRADNGRARLHGDGLSAEKCGLCRRSRRLSLFSR